MRVLLKVAHFFAQVAFCRFQGCAFARSPEPSGLIGRPNRRTKLALPPARRTIGVDGLCVLAHNDNKAVSREVSCMGFLAKMALYWSCDCCKAEWFADSEKAPRQCPSCHSRRWNHGMILDADLYAQSLRVVHLNPYRKPISFRQHAGLVRANAQRAAEARWRAKTAQETQQPSQT